VTETSASNGDRFKFAGMEYDSAIGQYYDRARDYDAVTGRFMSHDPKGFVAGDNNLYRYVGNAATNASDPTGLYAMEGGPTIFTNASLAGSPAASLAASLDGEPGAFIGVTVFTWRLALIGAVQMERQYTRDFYFGLARGIQLFSSDPDVIAVLEKERANTRAYLLDLATLRTALGKGAPRATIVQQIVDTGNQVIAFKDQYAADMKKVSQELGDLMDQFGTAVIFMKEFRTKLGVLIFDGAFFAENARREGKMYDFLDMARLIR